MTNTSILMEGLKGEPVKLLQAKLGVSADGIFGPATEKALKGYQQQHGLAVDGIAGPDTFASLGLQQLILLHRGSRGATVKKLQEALGVTADGIYGPGTEKAVRDYQQQHGLAVDGIAGPQTLAKLNLFGVTSSAVAASVAEAGKSLWDSVSESKDGALSKVKSFFGL